MMTVSAALKNVCFPGETMGYEFNITESGARFRTVCAKREVAMLDRGESHIQKMKAEWLDRLKSSKGRARR
jgi:hypothetical protein